MTQSTFCLGQGSSRAGAPLWLTGLVLSTPVAIGILSFVWLKAAAMVVQGSLLPSGWSEVSGMSAGGTCCKQGDKDSMFLLGRVAASSHPRPEMVQGTGPRLGLCEVLRQTGFYLHENRLQETIKM